MNISKENITHLRDWYKSKSQGTIKKGTTWALTGVLALGMASCNPSPKTDKELREDFKDVKKELAYTRQKLKEKEAEYEAFKTNQDFFHAEAVRINRLLQGNLSGKQRDQLEEQLENILEKLEKIGDKSDENEEERREYQEQVNKLAADSTSLDKQVGTQKKGQGIKIPPKRKFQ